MQKKHDNIRASSIIHYVETSPSILREMPWIQLKEVRVLTQVCIVIIHIDFVMTVYFTSYNLISAG